MPLKGTGEILTPRYKTKRAKAIISPVLFFILIILSKIVVGDAEIIFIYFNNSRGGLATSGP